MRFLFFMIIILGCGPGKPVTTPEYVKEIEEYYNPRFDRLRSETGWLNLVGLYWLKEGDNTFGSDSTNTIRMPDKAPPSGGVLTLRNGKIFLKAAKDAILFHKGNPVTSMEMATDADSNTTVIDMGSLRWFIIKRGSDFGIRLRDLESELVARFDGIDRYPVDAAWRFDARWEPYEPARQLLVPTILGTVDTSECNGALVFDVDGKTHRIDAVGKKTDDQLFLIFGDLTNNRETYGAGRYLYVKQADSLGRIVLDFNKAYNPPCVFTDYATCPFPPPQNKLHIAITAGEKMFKGGNISH
jgi:uncharacterized protein (DUF1684 family)